MRIGFISTYPPIECGIATYTKYLSDALRMHHNEIYVVSHEGGSGTNVFPAFDYEDEDLAERAFSMMMRFTPDIIHIQHEFGLYGKHFGVSVIPLIAKFHIAEIPVITTLHTVYPDIPKEHAIIMQSILYNSKYVIVHEEYQKDALKNTFCEHLTQNILVVPHGARDIESPQNAKETLKLPPGKKVILLIGYFRPTKNFELIVDLLPDIVQEIPDAILVIAGKVRSTEHIDYRNHLFHKINKSPVRDRIYLMRGQLPQETFDTILSAADVVALPYKTVSQSGILAHCFAHGKPVIVNGNDSMNFIMEKIKAGLICNSPQDFVANISQVLSDNALAANLSKNAREYVRNTISWDIIAKRHIEIYSDILKLPEIKANVIIVD